MAVTETEITHRISVSTSRESTELVVRPPIEDYEVYELGVHAVNGYDIDPRDLGQDAFEDANNQVKGATVIKAPDADRVRDAFASRGALIEAMSGIGITITDDRGRVIR